MRVQNDPDLESNVPSGTVIEQEIYLRSNQDYLVDMVRVRAKDIVRDQARVRSRVWIRPRIKVTVSTRVRVRVGARFHSSGQRGAPTHSIVEA